MKREPASSPPGRSERSKAERAPRSLRFHPSITQSGRCGRFVSQGRDSPPVRGGRPSTHTHTHDTHDRTHHRIGNVGCTPRGPRAADVAARNRPRLPPPQPTMPVVDHLTAADRRTRRFTARQQRAPRDIIAMTTDARLTARSPDDGTGESALLLSSDDARHGRDAPHHAHRKPADRLRRRTFLCRQERAHVDVGDQDVWRGGAP